MAASRHFKARAEPSCLNHIGNPNDYYWRNLQCKVSIKFTSCNNIWKVSKTKTYKIFFISDGTEDSEELATEVWDFETGNNWTFEPSLPPTGHADGIALYFVDAYFCKSSNSEESM